MPGLCKYRHILGEEGKGVHAVRVGNIAVIDVILTVAVACAISRGMRWHFIPTLAGAFGAGIVAHRMFCVRTTIDKLLFP